MTSTLQTGSNPFQKLLALRGLETPEAIDRFLHPRLHHLESPFLMHGMREAVGRLEKARAEKQKVLVHGDYDVDGITGTAIVSSALGKMGIAHQTFLPDRVRDGYGVCGEAIQRAAREGIQILIAVDCGISAREELAEARKAGIDAIVLDHHQIPREGLPPAFAILNPLQDACDYPFKEFSAGGLAFKLTQALLGQEAFGLLDLATLSTIADLAPLQGENRVIVQEGLKLLSERKRVGIRALAKAGKLKSRQFKASHVGFMLAPRINAAGRMSDASTALRLLLTSNEREADSLAQILEGENRARQQEERRIVNEAVNEVERTVNFAKERVMVVAKEGWHQGVIGIVAARLVERYYRPAFVIALENGKGKASARSIPSFHLFKALQTAEKHLLEFGGHAQAAGFSILEEEIMNLRKQVNEHAFSDYLPAHFIKSVSSDLELTLSDLTPAFLKELELLEPFGVGNPNPRFSTRGLRVCKVAPARGKFSRPQIWVTDGQQVYELSVTERSGVSLDLNSDRPFDLIYSIQQKQWEGETTVVLEAKGEGRRTHAGT